MIEKQSRCTAYIEEFLSFPVIAIERIEAYIFQSKLHQVKEINLIGDLIVKIIFPVPFLQIIENRPGILIDKTTGRASLIAESIELKKELDFH